MFFPSFRFLNNSLITNYISNMEINLSTLDISISSLQKLRRTPSPRPFNDPLPSRKYSQSRTFSMTAKGKTRLPRSPQSFRHLFSPLYTHTRYTQHKVASEERVRDRFRRSWIFKTRARAIGKSNDYTIIRSWRSRGVASFSEWRVRRRGCIIIRAMRRTWILLIL